MSLIVTEPLMYSEICDFSFVRGFSFFQLHYFWFSLIFLVLFSVAIFVRDMILGRHFILVFE